MVYCKINFKGIIAAVLLFTGVCGYAQRSAVYTHNDHDYAEALELYDKEKYGSAQKKFDGVMERIGNPTSEIYINAEYYAAVCALELFNKDAEYLLGNFIKNHPESPWVKIAYFQLGKYNYQRKKYGKAIAWFEKVDIYDLSSDELAEYYFKLGYSHFKEGNNAKANSAFYEVKATESEYKAPATYYNAHIEYVNGNYQTALEGFKTLETHESFGAVVPYYITQIYYLQRKYDEVLAYAPALLDSSRAKRAHEIARLIGESYYRTERYAEAVPYLEQYQQRGNPTRSDHYQLGYALYRSSNPEKALISFKRVTQLPEPDSLSQVTYYHSADCYVKLEQKEYARSAFRLASMLSFDAEIKEDALFNYAKLAYELSYNPFNEAVKAFTQYINDYPNSPRTQDAKEYLISVYMTTRNYDAALISLEQIADKGPRMETAYQMIAFNRGVEQFHGKMYDDAIKSFKKVKVYPVDRELNSESIYWIAESNYQMKRYEDAIVDYQRFQGEPGAFVSDLHNKANYSIGYAYYKKKDYPKATTWFRKFVGKYNEADERKLNDAYLRIGDSYLMNREYSNAIDYYDRAIKINLTGTDYALFQKGISRKLQQRYEAEATTLEKLLKDHPHSTYLVHAKFELGLAYQRINNNDKALRYYNEVVTEFPTSTRVKKALLQIGLIYFQKGQTANALEVFKEIVSKYPTLEDSREALATIKEIYIAQGNIEEYNAYVESLTFFKVPTAQLDSTNYMAAENRYLDGDCERASEDFERYINKFNPAIFANNAYFYKAECDYRANRLQEALRGYNYVISQSVNKFTESALLAAATINYQLQDYAAALGNYSSLENVAEFSTSGLEAQIGQMRCFFHLGNYEYAMEYAKKVVINTETPAGILEEANFTIGKSLKALEMYDMALEELTKLAATSQSVFGAEAKYLIAEIYYIKDEYKTSEQHIFELVQRVPRYEKWLGMGFVLLADNYVKLGEVEQAKHTLESLIEKHTDTDVVVLAQEKLDAILAMEAKQEERKKMEEIEIGFGEEYDELFEEEEPEEEPDRKQRKKERKANKEQLKDKEGATGSGEEGNEEKEEGDNNE